ncbi:MAG TPA: cytochrome c oxidase subunit 3 [Gemmatimonadaceae bacterium]|nr:cytochrome c oxidase subunit 3 [Gemmatimonadaceae bacterium]
MKRRPTLDAVTLTDQGFRNHAPIWWGNRFVMIIEAAGFAILIATYFDIRHNFDSWPPARTQLPDLPIPTLNVAILVVSVLPMWYAAKLAVKNDKVKVIGALLFVCVVFGIAAAVIRILEFKSVHTRWDANAYGAIVWSILAVHFAHIIAATFETLSIAILVFIGPVEDKSYVDITANAVYWYFVALSWVAFYALLFLAPRFT